MKVDKLALEETGNFSKLFIDYLNNSSKLAPTHSFEPSIDGFEKALSYRKLSQENRDNLIEVIEKQYDGLSVSEEVGANIAAIKDSNTFTVTTGHQLNIFTGPLFFIYKIVTAINICKQLAKKFPEYNFVPVYWMASEDHDFDEINHTFVDGKKYVWQTEQEGAVGRFNTAGLAEIAEKMSGQTGRFKQAYGKAETLADAVRTYVNSLFGEYGLVVVDADHQLLKKEFSDIVKEELLEQSSYKAVLARSSFLNEQGYKAQLNSREINLFYLDDNLRSRIELKDGIYSIVDTELKFTKDEILNILDTNPEKFSPNVILRPLYQEVILPNLGYVGGPAEIAYWLQFKEMFDHYKIDFPVVMPRTFGLHLEANYQQKMKRLGISYADLFKDINILEKEFVHSINDNLKLNQQRKDMEKIYDSMKNLAQQIDITLGQHIDAQLTKHNKDIDNIEAKFVKAEKRNREDEISMIAALKDYVFPGGTLQERKVNFLSINNDKLIEELIELTDPFDLRMHIYLD